MRAAIIGGGVGGLTAAIALRKAGIEAVVYERAADLHHAQAGGGLQLWSNAMVVLRELEAAEPLESAATVLRQLDFRTWHDRSLIAWSFDEAHEKFGEPTLGIARGDLYAGLASVLDDDAVQLGRVCTGFQEDAEGVTVLFADGAKEQVDLLVGADGVRSTVREKLGLPTKPRHAGFAIWRAITDFDHERTPLGTFRILWGPGSHFAFFHVGGGRLYWSAAINAAEGASQLRGAARRPTCSSDSARGRRRRGRSSRRPRRNRSSLPTSTTAIRPAAGAPAASPCSATPRTR